MQFKTKYETSPDGIIYANLSLNNTTNTYLSAEITDTRGQPIIKNPSDYFCAVARFSIPLYSTCLLNLLPYMSNTIDTNLSFTLSFNGGDSTQTFIKFLSSAPLDGTYFIYDYTVFLEMCNIALADAFLSLPSIPPTITERPQAPYFIFNPVSQLISLICQSEYYDSSLSTPIQIYYNNLLLETLFYSIPNITYARVSPNGKNNLFRPINQYNNIYVSSIALYGPAYEMSQQYISLGYWNSLNTILILSNNLSTVPETTSSIIQNTTNDTSLQILTDFKPDFYNNAGTYSSIAVYTAGFGDYRLINMYSADPLYKIDISIKWADNFGNIYPIYLINSQIITLKLAFIPKSFYYNKQLKY